MRRRGGTSFLLALALVAPACSSLGSPDSSTVGSASPALAISDLSGGWENGRVALRVNDAGEYVVLPVDGPDQPDALTGGFVARDQQSFHFVTGIGRLCPGQTGIYRATMESDMLSLILVEDPCVERVAWFEEPFSRSTG